MLRRRIVIFTFGTAAGFPRIARTYLDEGPYHVN